MSLRSALSRATSGAQLVAALLVAAVALRFTVSAVSYALATRTSAPSEAASYGGLDARPLAFRREWLEPAEVMSSSPAKSDGAATPPAAVRVPLIVTVGPDRSELYVDGVQVGRVPFVGEVSCRGGERVVIEVVPPKGKPSRYEALCGAGAVRLSD
jgi:hypothetical protein